MLSDEKIKESFGLKNILKKYPKSGQKQVLLVDHVEFGLVILKLVVQGSERIKREISIVTENDFKNVPRVIVMDEYSVEGENGIYIIEQYIEGETLRERLLRGKISFKESLDLAKAVLSIIVQMEEKSVVHRDIKPENIIYSTTEGWFLIDFGIARALNLNSLTLTEVQVGPHTPGYGAPELFQYSKKDIDSRADIFSLGVVLFEASTGKHPFLQGDEMNLNEIWYNTVTVVPQNISIEGDEGMLFMGLIQTFMQKHITRRPRTAKKAWEWFTSVERELEGN